MKWTRKNEDRVIETVFLRSSGWHKGDNMKWLVCRTDALKPGAVLNSSMFPIVVESEQGRYYSHEEIAKKAMSTIRQDYVGMHSYLVVPLADAMVVTFKPRPNYDVEVERYYGQS